MNNQIQTKNELDNKFLAAFDREVVKIEKRNIRDLTKFYQKNYNQGISNFLEYNTTRYESLFTNRDLQAEYQKMYISIGNHIAKWYFRIFKKYQTKNDFGPYESEWEKSFAKYASDVAATNVTLVGGTAKKTLIKLTQQLMRDPEFMQLGNDAKARILKQKFNRYSKYQANRLVRTESTRAANFAVEKSAKTLFSENDLSKRWLAVMDGKERIWHRAANGQTVRMDQDFVVGNESMKRPGEGSARNVINCRCRIIPIPDENAIPVTELDEIGVGLGQSRIEDFSLGNLGRTVSEVIETIAARNVIDDVSEITQKEKMTPDNWKQVVGGAKIDDDYLELLDTKLNVKIVRGDAGSFQQGTTIQINIDKYGKKTRGSVLSHEVGHAIHEQRGWLTLPRNRIVDGRYVFEQSKTHPLIQELFYKHRSFFGADLRGKKRTEFQKLFIKKFYSGKSRSFADYHLSRGYKNKLRSKFPKLSDAEFDEYWISVVDYIGAVTKNQVGYGHATSYYANQQWQKFEMFAHIMENKYHGNPVFKKLFPGLHKEGIDMLNKLIKEYKLSKP